MTARRAFDLFVWGKFSFYNNWGQVTTSLLGTLESLHWRALQLKCPTTPNLRPLSKSTQPAPNFSLHGRQNGCLVPRRQSPASLSRDHPGVDPEFPRPPHTVGTNYAKSQNGPCTSSLIGIPDLTLMTRSANIPGWEAVPPGSYRGNLAWHTLHQPYSLHRGPTTPASI